MAGRALGDGRATILDVARAAGVSRQTVSNALNHPARVSPATLDRVTREIHRLGFTPNATAQQLRRRRASAYGFEVNPAGVSRMGHVLDEFLVELTGWAPSHTSHLVTFSAPADDVLSAYQSMLGTGLVDGFVLANTRHGDPRPTWLLEHGVPFVAFGRLWDLPELTQWVDVDGRAGVRAAVAHLAEAALVEAAAQDLEEAPSAAARLIDRLGEHSAVVCASDLLALDVMRAVRDAGLQPGADIGILLGPGDVGGPVLLRPHLTIRSTTT